MHRTNGAGHVGNLFVNEDPATNRPPTEVPADWLNAVQEEIVNVATMNGEVLEAPGADGFTQMRDAILARIAAISVDHGQCELVLSGGNLKLLPLNGNKLIINGTSHVIPSAGVSLAAAGTTPGNTYLIYAFMNAGVMELEYSATGHSTDASTGVEIKTGDASRTLVGMARAVTGPAWQVSSGNNQRFVRSWFNRKKMIATQMFAASRSTTSSTPVESNSADRCEWLAWADEEYLISAQSNCWNSNAACQASFDLKLDGTTTLDSTGAGSAISNQGVSISTTPWRLVLSEGYHYASLFLYQTGGGTATFNTTSGITVSN